MPGFNQTGPDGTGPMTGRRMGRCTNYGASIKNQNVVNKETNQENISEDIHDSDLRFGRGRGWARGRGMGYGRQNRFRGGF